MKTMTMKIKILIALTFAASYANAQQPASFQDQIRVGTVSPDVASLGKFGNIPINYSTGASNITIPVFQINAGQTQLPISLDYHTGGIRVNEVSSSVGIGWTLKGIGMIYRNMIDLPDEGGGGYLYTPSADSVYNDWAAGGIYGQTTDNAIAEYLYGVRIGTDESEPDIFSYTINGQSGKFIYKKDGTIMQIPHTNNQIIQVPGAGFKIIDEKGTVYIFDLQEHTSIPNPDVTIDYTSTWRLSKIVDPNSIDTIFISYESACGVNMEQYLNYTYSFGQGPNCSVRPLGTIDYTGENFSMVTINHPDELFPSQITWRGGKISFINACDRKDNASEKRLSEIDVYSNLNDTLKLTKAMKLYQSYFYSDLVGDSINDQRNYRLRLDSVSSLSTNLSGQPMVYRLSYDTIHPMASRYSPAQDLWGFNNGQFNNPTPMPKETVVYNGAYHNIGEADRDPDSSSMLACMLNSIQYPTGGKTVFAFEPHRYNTNTSYTKQQNLYYSATGGFQSTTQATFTPDSLGSSYMLTYNFSSYNYSDVTDRPRITITDQTTNQQVFLFSSNIDPTQGANNAQSPASFSPVLGHTYLININIYTSTDINVTASLNISWTDTYKNVPNIAIGGGLRVKSMTDYDNNGNFISKKIFQYGSDGTGQLLTPANYLLVNFEKTIYQCGQIDSPSSGCIYYRQNSDYSLTYHADNVYPASQYSGSPVLYDMVTDYQVDSLGNPKNGKTIYYYSIYDDQPVFASDDYGKVGVLLMNSLWKNGFLGEQDDYKYNPTTNTYILEHKHVNSYLPDRPDTVNVLKIRSLLNWNTSQCYLFSMQNANSEYFLVKVPVTSGAMLLHSSTDTYWDNSGNPFTTSTDYFYNDPTHLFVTSRQSLNSKNQTLSETLKYPHDFASAGNVYQKMITRNIIAPVIQDIKYNSGTQEFLTNTNYNDWFGNSNLLLPQTIQQQIGSNPLSTRIQFDSYDIYGNILQQHKLNDANHAYLWDYHNTYPIAEAVNAASNEIAYTSFEADGKGNWSFSGLPVADASAITGNMDYALSAGSISTSGLTNTKAYIVSYWSKNGPATVSGSTSTTQGLTKNGWTYYEHTLPAGTTTVTLSGTATIDELRLYPSDAQMTTYTYQPLVGMTSRCSANNVITYYDYDGLERLQDIKDQDGNIIKTFEYNYKQ